MQAQRMYMYSVCILYLLTRSSERRIQTHEPVVFPPEAAGGIVCLYLVTSCGAADRLLVGCEDWILPVTAVRRWSG